MSCPMSRIRGTTLTIIESTLPTVPDFYNNISLTMLHGNNRIS
jgi:hypothetical protein